MRRIVTALLAAAALAAPAAARETPDAKLSKLLAGRVAGAPSNCLPLNRTGPSQIVPGKAIVYRTGGTLWVNEPRSGADSLREDVILVTRTIGTQLCSIDTVRLIDRGTNIPRGFVILGQFVPYRLSKDVNASRQN